MTTINVSSAAQLEGALASAVDGEVICLAAGNYGDVVITGKNFATGLTLISADPAHAATLNTLSVTASSGIDFEGLHVNMAATMTTTAFTPAVAVTNSSNITFGAGLVTADRAINGVVESATTLDSTGNVIGYPTGRGFSLLNSTGVTIRNTEITQVNKGVVISSSDGVSILNNNIHDFRTSSIVGADNNHVTIDSNHLSSSNPWHSGSGDHADFIHFWTAAGPPSTDFTITNNTLDTADGVSPLGIYLDDNGNNLGFTHVTITNNLIFDGVGQGMRLENVSGTVSGNTLLDSVGNSRHAPGIVADGSHDLEIFGNTTAFAKNDANSSANIHDNVIIQDTKATGPGYYTPDLVSQARTLDPATAYDQVLHALGAPVSTPLAVPNVAPPIVVAPTMPAVFDIHVSDVPGSAGTPMSLWGGWL